jgi:O-antigen/teichoic acid export membrane protein
VTAAVSAGVNVALNAWLIPRFGLVGCAWATTGAYGASMVAAACLVYLKIPSSRAWAIQATLPALMGALYVVWRGDSLGAMGLTLLVSALVALLRRRAILVGVGTLKSAGCIKLKHTLVTS